MSQQNSEHPFELISALADGEVTAEERKIVDDHLQACAGCRTLLDDLRLLGSAAAAEAAPGVPADLAARIRWRLRGEEKEGARKTARSFWRSPLPISTAAGLVVAAAVLWVLRGEFGAVKRPRAVVVTASSEVSPDGDIALEAPLPQLGPETEKVPERAMSGELADRRTGEELYGGESEEPDQFSMMKRPSKKLLAEKRYVAPPPAVDEGREEDRARERVEARGSLRNFAVDALGAVDDVEETASAKKPKAKEEAQGSLHDLPIQGRNYSDVLKLSSGATDEEEGKRILTLESAGYRITIAESGLVAIKMGDYACMLQALPPSPPQIPRQEAERPGSIESIFSLASSADLETARADTRAQPEGQREADYRRVTVRDTGSTLVSLDYREASAIPPAVAELERRVRTLVSGELRSRIEERCGAMPGFEESEP
jgi:hypothetical protein